METGEHSVLSLSENSLNSLTNNNSIQLNGSNTIDDTIAINQKDNELKRNTEIPKPNVFELIGGNKNCDSGSNDCCNKKKTILNNNDLPIGFVDDDDDVDETNGEIEDGATKLNHCNSDEAVKGHENGLFVYFVFIRFGIVLEVSVKVQSTA